MQGCAVITSWGSTRDSAAGFLIPLMKNMFGNEQHPGPACLNWHTWLNAHVIPFLEVLVIVCVTMLPGTSGKNVPR